MLSRILPIVGLTTVAALRLTGVVTSNAMEASFGALWVKILRERRASRSAAGWRTS